MNKNFETPHFQNTAIPTAPPSYEQAVGGVPPINPYTPQQIYLNNADIVTTVVPIGEGKTHMVCPSCHQEIDTTITPEPSQTAFLLSCLLCFMGCFVCALVPCCLDECRDVHHNCPNCNAYIGKYPADFGRLGRRPLLMQSRYYPSSNQN